MFIDAQKPKGQSDLCRLQELDHTQRVKWPGKQPGENVSRYKNRSQKYLRRETQELGSETRKTSKKTADVSTGYIEDFFVKADEGVAPRSWVAAEGTFETGSSSTVLIVDDCPMNRHLFKASLKAANFAVSECKDGAACLEYLQSNPPPALILLDVMMPGLSGFEVLKEIRKQYTQDTLPELIGTEGGRRFPVVVAGQIDVFPAQRRQMGEITGFGMVPLPSKMIDGSLQVGRVP